MTFSWAVGNKVELIMFMCETRGQTQTVKCFEKTGEGFRLLFWCTNGCLCKRKTFGPSRRPTVTYKGGNSTTVCSNQAFRLDKRVKEDSMSADIENISGATLCITGPQKVFRTLIFTLTLTLRGHRTRLRLQRSWAGPNFRPKSKKSRNKEEVCGDPAAPQTVSLKTVQQLVSNKAQSGPSAQL